MIHYLWHILAGSFFAAKTFSKPGEQLRTLSIITSTESGSATKDGSETAEKCCKNVQVSRRVSKHYFDDAFILRLRYKLTLIKS